MNFTKRSRLRSLSTGVISGLVAGAVCTDSLAHWTDDDSAVVSWDIARMDGSRGKPSFSRPDRPSGLRRYPWHGFYLLESHYTPWWVSRSRRQEEIIDQRRKQIAGSGPALWVLVVLLALIMPVIFG